MGTLWGRSSSLEWDDNAELAEGALAYFYEAGTSTPKAVYSDGGESTAHEFPVEADGGRWPAVFIPFGSYKVVIKTDGGTTLFSADNVPNPEPFDATFEVDEEAQLNTGDVFFSLKNGLRAGACRLNGQSIGDASSGASQRAHADTADLFAFLWNNIPNTQAPVLPGGRGVNAAVDFAAHKTITLPSARGAHPLGFDDMGNTAAGLLSSTPVVTGDTVTAGSVLGANTHALTTAQLPQHSHSFSTTSGAGSSHTHAVTGNTGAEAAHTHTGTTGTESADHTHSYNTAASKTGTATGFGTVTGTIWNGADTAATSGGKSATHTHAFTSDAGSSHLHSISLTSGAEAAHTHAVSGETAVTGGNESHNNVARSLLVTWYIKL